MKLVGAAVAALLGFAPLGALAAGDQSALALTHDYGCMACHGMVRKQVGPGFAEIAQRYRNDPAASAQLAGRIRGGSVGQWGRVIMPRQPRMTDEESALLAKWVLSQPPSP